MKNFKKLYTYFFNLSRYLFYAKIKFLFYSKNNNKHRYVTFKLRDPQT